MVSKQVQKGPRTAFIIFSSTIRSKLLEEHPDASPQKLMMLLAERWNSCPQEEKERFYQESQKEKDEKTKSKEIKSEQKRIKRPKHAYIFFVDARRPLLKQEYPDMNSFEIIREIAILWNCASEEERQIYNDMNKEDQQRYEREKASQRVTQNVMSE